MVFVTVFYFWFMFEEFSVGPEAYTGAFMSFVGG
jgi:hypothetical protein